MVYCYITHQQQRN